MPQWRSRYVSARSEAAPLLRLAAPLVIAEIGWMTMAVVDTVMVGRIGAASIGAISVAGILASTVQVAGTGVMYGLDTIVSQSFGAGRPEVGRRALASALYVALPLGPLLMAAIWWWQSRLAAFQITPAVLREAVPYLRAVMWSTMPVLLYTAFRRYLQSENLVRPIMFANVSANIVNAAGNWALIWGHWGMPALGSEGAGWSTCLSRLYLAAALLAAIVMARGSRFRRADWRPDWGLASRLIGLGAPAGIQIAFEVGVFALASILIAKLDAPSVAGHQIALNCASVTFLITLGIGSAAAVRVGQAAGRGDLRAAALSGWTGLAIGGVIMCSAGLAFALFAPAIIRGYTPDASVAVTGVVLLRIAAIFQPFDGIQAIATGALRGLGDTRTSAVCHIAGYWLIGLPLGWWLCFRAGWGASGMWTGLCAAIVLIGSALLWAWNRRVRRQLAQEAGLSLAGEVPGG